MKLSSSSAWEKAESKAASKRVWKRPRAWLTPVASLQGWQERGCLQAIRRIWFGGDDPSWKVDRGILSSLETDTRRKYFLLPQFSFPVSVKQVRHHISWKLERPPVWGALQGSHYPTTPFSLGWQLHLLWGEAVLLSDEERALTLARTQFKYWVRYLLAVWHWVSHLTSLSLNSLMCKVWWQ